MPANTSPIFTLTPRVTLAQVSAANTNRDGTGTIVDLITGATNGTRIDRITIKAVGTTTAGMVRLYIYDGTNTRLWKEEIVSAITPSAVLKTFQAILSDLALTIPLNHKLQASTHNAETFNIETEAGDF